MDNQKIERHLFTFILIFTIISLCIIPFASAATLCAESNTSVTYVKYLADGFNQLTAQAFQGNGEYLTSCEFQLIREGDLTGYTIHAHLFVAGTGTYGSTLLPNDMGPYDVGQVSNSIDCNTIGGSKAYYGFNFTGNYQLSNSSYYFIALQLNDYTGTDTFHTIKVYYGSGFAGNMANYDEDEALWTAASTDFDFKVWTSGTPAATPTPTPTLAPGETVAPTVNPAFTETWETLASLINLLVPLLCVILPAFFGYKFAGAWGFMAGVNIGAILAYTILGSEVFPLWGIVALLIIDALLLFGKVGLHE